MNEGSMSWTEKAGDYECGTVAAPYLHAAVRWRRLFGVKVEHAIEDAAKPFGMGARRVRGFLRGEVARVARAELAAIKAAFRSDREAHIRELKTMTARLEAEAARDVPEQGELPLEF